MKEETGVTIKTLKNKGNLKVEYPNRIFDFEVFIINEYDGTPQEFKENTSEWIKIEDLLQKEKIFSNIMLLDRFFIKGLLDENYKFNMHIQIDDNENILDVKFKLNNI